MNNINEHAFHDALQNQATPKLMITIVNRRDGEQAARTLQNMHLRLIHGCMGEGTAGKGLADLMGFGPSGKLILMGIIPGTRARIALEELQRFLHLDKPGRGIAFTIPLSGIELSEKLPLDPMRKAHIQKKIEKSVDIMSEGIKNDLILAAINQGYSEALIECAQSAGITGGTVLNARHLSAETMAAFLGISLRDEREIVAILVTRDLKDKVMEQIAAFLHETPKAQGAIISLPVDNVIGIPE